MSLVADLLPPDQRNHGEIYLYTVSEVQARIRISYNQTILFIRKYITPVGGTVKIGGRLLVHAWGFNYALEQRRWGEKRPPKSDPRPHRGGKSSPQSKYLLLKKSIERPSLLTAP